MTDQRVQAAARNNAAWCDAMARAWRQPTRATASYWLNEGVAPPFHPNLVTLQDDDADGAQRDAVTGLQTAAPSQALAIKDSFRTFDLTPMGFRILFDAAWIWREASTPPPKDEDGLRWSCMREPAALTAWEAAWRKNSGDCNGPVFPPALLSEPDHTFIAAMRGDRIIAGCVAKRSQELIGITNIFLTTGEDSQVLAGCMAVAAAVAPNLPLAGYEAGNALEAMKSLGFRSLGPLRVWLRDSA